jgi:hypothetical protein
MNTPDRWKRHITEFVKDFWDVFREDGIKLPIHGYNLVIDTGDHQPITVKEPHYGLHEIPIMEKQIDWLLNLGHVKCNILSPRGSQITLPPKPHQEHIKAIKDCIWQFCVNYILLNKITHPAQYPIPRCDDAQLCMALAQQPSSSFSGLFHTCINRCILSVLNRNTATKYSHI